LDEFRVAAKVFWVSYSAYSRGIQEPRGVDALLKLLSNEFEVSWHETAEFDHIWREEYKTMVNFYVQKVKHYGNLYMNSPAGIALKATLDKSRKRHGALPSVNEQTILKYAGLAGLRWNISDVADFFEILAEFTATTSFETSVSLNLMPSH
jgi:hypothetical protein